MKWWTAPAMLLCLVVGFCYGIVLASEAEKPSPVDYDLDHQQITAYCADGVFITARIDVTREDDK